MLQYHADDNNTMTPVIYRFMAITKRLGQTNTINFLDQPLYSRGKEIIWADLNKYKDVILMMGGLQISFNFLKAIGQHMDSSGLDDLWVEGGPTYAMMEGKAYYRAVRAHIWTFEALYCIKWKQFKEWATEK